MAQFGQDLNANDIEKIKTTVDNSILYQGDDIEQGATYLKDNEGNIKLFDLEKKRVGTLQIIPQT